MNKSEREVAGKDLVNSYGVAETFVKNLFIVSNSITQTKKVMASNLIFVMSNLDNKGDGTSSGIQNLVQISLYSSVTRERKLPNLPIVTV